MTNIIQRIRRGDKFDAKTKADLLTYVEQLESCKLPGVSVKVHAKIAARLEHARREHPDNTFVESIQAVVGETEELVNAWHTETTARMMDENLDVAICAIRLANKEYISKTV